MNNATQPQSRKCIGGCGRKVSPPARKCPMCRKSIARIARRRRSGGGGRSHGGSSFALLQSSVSDSSIFSVNPHDVLVDAMLNRADAETPMLDMVFERE